MVNDVIVIIIVCIEKVKIFFFFGGRSYVYYDRLGVNFLVRMVVLSDNFLCMENLVVLRYCIIFFCIEFLLNILCKRKIIGKGNINFNKNYL